MTVASRPRNRPTTPRMVADPLPWTADAACLSIGPEIFFPEMQTGTVAAYRQARSICERCPVLNLCLSLALDAEGTAARNQRYGMYGGLTPGERHDIARGRRAA